MKIIGNNLFKHLAGLLILISIIFSYGCQLNSGNSASTGTTNASQNDQTSGDTGEVNISLTDAPGDFTNYTVDVVSLTLTKANGTVVSVIPEQVSVDFSQYVDMTELLTAATVPAGIYTSATMKLDYSNAQIFVENSSGDSQQVSSIKDENGNAITTLDVSVGLDGTNELLIKRGVPALLSLDFNLKASNVVTFDGNDANLVVSPTLNASLESDPNKIHRIRGPLQSVDLVNNTITLYIKPFFKSIKTSDHHFGHALIHVNDQTAYDISGTTYTGSDGLNQINALQNLTGIIVEGAFDISSRTFTASQVYAGSSVPGGTMDGLTGTVVSRSGNTLLVKGATLERTNGKVSFNNDVSVTIGDNTIIKKPGDSSTQGINAISVGQQITVLGSLGGDSSSVQMDATQGYVRLNLSQITGNVDTGSQITQYPLALNVLRINNRNVSNFDFSGTGTSAQNDADHKFYEIDTSTLDVSSLANNQLIKVRGFVAPFGQAPADFEAKSIIDPGKIPAMMQTDWTPASTSAFSEASATKITLDFTGTGKFHYIGRGHERFDLTQFPEFSLVPNSTGKGIFLTQSAKGKTLNTSFSLLSDDINTHLSNGETVKRILAKGLFDSSTGEMQTAQVIIIFH